MATKIKAPEGKVSKTNVTARSGDRKDPRPKAELVITCVRTARGGLGLKREWVPINRD